MNDLLESFGTFRLPYVITLQRQLPTHDLNEVLREQTCREGTFQKRWKSWRSSCCCECVDRGFKHQTMAAVIVKMIPSGSALLKLRAVMMLLTSLSMLFATPGYWKKRFLFFNSLYFVTFVFVCYLWANTPLTWIFMATSLPSFIRARCTWPIDAAANGFSSKYSRLSLQFGPRSLQIAFCRDKKIPIYVRTCFAECV